MHKADDDDDEFWLKYSLSPPFRENNNKFKNMELNNFQLIISFKNILTIQFAWPLTQSNSIIDLIRILN